MSQQPFFIRCQQWVPQHALSRVLGWLAGKRWRRLKNFAIRQFVGHYGVNLQEARYSAPEAYVDFNAFFTRELQPGARQFVDNPLEIIAPVDGCVSQIGHLHQETLVQAKGVDYSLSVLLAGQTELKDQFTNGAFTTLYLAPKDYHRVHMPVAGQLKEMIYVPGALFSVNHQTAAHVPNLFARNERLICVFETAFGPMTMILVGAMIVAGIHTVWHGKIAPAKRKTLQHWRYADRTITLNKGDEMGHFQLGSTVILLFPEHTLQWSTAFQPDSVIKMGQQLANYQTVADASVL